MEKSMKRPLEDKNDLESKRVKIEQPHILYFSDCVLLKILSHLKSYDLYCLSKTCQRFKYLIKERKLWRKVDTLDHPMCARKFKFFFENVNASTDSLMVRGISRKEKTLTFSQFLKISKLCDNLTILAIENQYINSDEIGLKDFPPSLEELSLRGTHIYGRHPFLQEAHLKLNKLHTLILDDCKWFHEHSLMALSKLKSLENLSLYKCANLNDSVAYMSITAKFGFRKLLRIDARCTSVGDQFLKCFHCIKTLREIYLEAPQRSRNTRNATSTPTKCNRSTANLLDELQRLCGQALSRNNSNNNNNNNNNGGQPAAGSSDGAGAASAAVGAVAGSNSGNASASAEGCAPAEGQPVDGNAAGCIRGHMHMVGERGASAVVFNRSQFFKLRRDRIKPTKRPRKTSLPSPRDLTFNCLENCENCSIETCSIIPINTQYTELSDAQTQLVNSQDTPSSQTSSQPGSSSSGQSSSRVRKYCRKFRPSFAGYITFRDANCIEIEPDKTYYQRSVQNNLRAIARAAEQCLGRRNHIALRRELSLPQPEPSTSRGTSRNVEDDVPEEQRPSSPTEVYYCDDVSDSEDEAEAEAAALLELDMLQADVTDFGVQWFCSAVPDEDDYEGQPTTLFRRPYREECYCKIDEETKRRDEPGPSGYKYPSSSEPVPSTSKTPRSKSSKSKNSSSPLPSTSCSFSASHGPSTSRGPPIPSEGCFHNDVTVNVSGQGAVCLKIAYETNDDNIDQSPNNNEAPVNVNPPAPPPPPPVENRDLRVIIQGEEEIHPPERDNYPIRGRLIIENANRDEQNLVPQRARDLRVIIERLDPGVHIVYDQGGRVQFDNLIRDYTTRLKVFVARGYKLITNNALRSLTPLRLELLDVTGTNVNAKGIKEFLMVNPDCKVIHESTCHCAYNG